MSSLSCVSLPVFMISTRGNMFIKMIEKLFFPLCIPNRIHDNNILLHTVMYMRQRII